MASEMTKTVITVLIIPCTYLDTSKYYLYVMSDKQVIEIYVPYISCLEMSRGHLYIHRNNYPIYVDLDFNLMPDRDQLITCWFNEINTAIKREECLKERDLFGEQNLMRFVSKFNVTADIYYKTK